MPSNSLLSAAMKWGPGWAQWKSFFKRYGIAIGFTLIAIVIRIMLHPILGSRIPFTIYLPAVVFATWYGGAGPGIFTAVVCAMYSVWQYVPPPGSLYVPDAADRIVLLVNGLVAAQLIVLALGRKNAQSRAAGAVSALEHQSEELAVTLGSIGDAVVVSDIDSRITYLNPAAEILTGWKNAQARGRPLTEVCKLIDENTRLPIADVSQGVIARNRAEGLASNCLLIAADGVERAVDDNVAPVHGPGGEIRGVVLIMRDVSKHRADLEALRISEAQFRLTFDQSPIGAAIVSLGDFKFLQVNTELLRITGYTREELTSSTFASITHPDDIAEDLRLARLLTEGKIDQYQLDKRYIRKDGNSIWVRLYARVVKDAHGRPIYALPMIADITPEKEAESALRQGEERLNLALDAITGGEWDWNVKTGSVIFSARWRKWLGYGIDDLKSDITTWESLIHPADKAQVTEFLNAHFSGQKEFYKCQYRIMAKDGNWRWSQDLGKVVNRDESGNPVRMVGIDVDITELKQAEAALRENQERYREFVEGTDNIVTQVDTQGRFTYVNPAYARFIGLPQEELLSKFAFDFIHPDDRERTREAFRSWVNDRVRSATIENRQVNQFGASCDMSWTVTCHYDQNCNVAYFNSIARDITAQRRAEENWLEADRQKNQFMAELGHELRTPLAAMLNAVHVLRHLGPSDPTLERARDAIERQIASMTRMIEDLLDVSRLKHGKLSLSLERVDISQIIRNCTEDLRESLAHKKLALEVHTPREAVWVDADRVRVSQIVTNLLNNAAKFTDAGGKVTVSLQAHLETHRAVISVRDTGVGMSTATISRIFDPYVQAHETLSRSRTGLGLGLALVKGLVELQDGSVRASSGGIGKGSEFVVELPLQAAPVAAAKAKAPIVEEKQLQTRRVLIVEDDFDTAESLATFLDALGHRVDVAYDGTSALQKAREMKPEVILSDIGLTGKIDGYTLARELRANPDFQSTYMIAMTGMAMPQDILRIREAGFNMHLQKPFSPVALDNFLRGIPAAAGVCGE